MQNIINSSSIHKKMTQVKNGYPENKCKNIKGKRQNRKEEVIATPETFLM